MIPFAICIFKNVFLCVLSIGVIFYLLYKLNNTLLPKPKTIRTTNKTQSFNWTWVIIFGLCYDIKHFSKVHVAEDIATTDIHMKKRWPLPALCTIFKFPSLMICGRNTSYKKVRVKGEAELRCSNKTNLILILIYFKDSLLFQCYHCGNYFLVVKWFLYFFPAPTIVMSLFFTLCVWYQSPAPTFELSLSPRIWWLKNPYEYWLIYDICHFPLCSTVITFAILQATFT